MSRTKTHIKSIISVLTTICMLVAMMPSSVMAAQSNEYVDPADNWITSNNRTNELDINATTTYETQFCQVCEKYTTTLTYRVPEYTKSGETALNRDVKWSDGTKLNGYSTGNLDDGTPGVDAYYTGYHWGKSVCQTCGTINSINEIGSYSFNNNVYGLYNCDHSFFLEFDNTTYESYDEEYHLTTLKRGEYCQFCKGTFARASRGLEEHNFIESVDAQLGNNRFYIKEQCKDCGYETSEYITAKSVVSSYYGIEDKEAHTLTVTDLSDRGVKTSILYGDSADSCTKTSAPNYTKVGYYTVYYKINYTYAGETMTENGVSYVWIVDNNTNDGVVPAAHEHDYHYLETVKPSCDALGYDRFQCNGCGDLIKTNYTQLSGHTYSAVTIRESSCKQGGLNLWLCSNCGDFYEETTPLAEHKYTERKNKPTCKVTGYTDHICEVCGDNYITDIEPIISHSYEGITKEATCIDKGYTTHTCTMCGYHYVSDYTEPLGHKWDSGRIVTNSTCDSEGVIEFHCTNDNCSEKMIKATNAKGHTHGDKATCTDPQRCSVCDTVLELPTGHKYSTKVTEPTCTEMGYTVYTCKCGDTHAADYTEKKTHTYSEKVTAPTCTQHGFTTYTCTKCDDEYIGDYTVNTEHKYVEDVILPTCTKIGYTVFKCENCDSEYKGEYKEATGHKHTDWIVDTDATIEYSGTKHIECGVCGETLVTAEIPQLGDRDFSDEDGNAVIGTYSIKLYDDNDMPVFNTELTIDVLDNLSIILPEGRLLDYADRTTIEVTKTETGKGVENIAIVISDANGNNAAGITDENGILKVPNNQSSTGSINGTIGTGNTDEAKTFVVTVTDKTNTVIPNCDIEIGESNNIVVDLPDGIKPARENPVIVTVTEHNGKEKQGIAVIAIGDSDFVEKGITDIYGKVTLPTSSVGYTDSDGKVNVDSLNITVTDEKTAISNAYVKHNEDNTITVILPEGKIFDYNNRIAVMVADKNNLAVKDIEVNVSEYVGADAEVKTLSAKTNSKGIATFPPLTEDMTDEKGDSGVTEEIPGKGEDTDSEGEKDTPGDDVVINYTVKVNDTKGIIEGVFIEIKDGKVTVTLPETHTLTTDNQTTVTVLDTEGKPVKKVFVTVKDTSIEKSASTNANGQITVPVKASSGGSSGGGGGSYVSVTIKVTDKGGKSVNVSKSTGTSKATLTLPIGRNLEKDNDYYTITVTDRYGKAKENYTIALKDKNKNEISGTTDDDGIIILPAKTHSSYIVGYDDGTFKADKSMTRAETATIFARLIAEEKGEKISGNASFNDVTSDKWYASYIGYLEKYDIIKGYSDKTFRSENCVTRAEFVTMAVRYYDLFNDIKKTGYSVKYTDVSSCYWAYTDIAYAKHIGWLNGYSDGSFRADNFITRAEVVTVVNRATGRNADKEYINDYFTKLNRFTDVSDSSFWYFYDVYEAANAHKAIVKNDSETWVK